MLKQGQALQIIRQIHPCLWKKIKKNIGLMKDELGGQIVKKFVLLQSKMQSYLIDNNDEGTKVKCTKSCDIKRKLKFQDYSNYFKAS